MKKQPISPMVVRRQLTKKLLSLLEKDKRVLLVLAFGSTADKQENELSDTDLCVVMKDDEALKEALGEVNSLFHRLGPLSGYYNYSPYHFYVVYEGPIPLDIYLISASLYFIVKGARSKIVVDHRQTFAKEELSQAEKLCPMVKDLLVRANIRNFRLLSKLVKKDYVTLIYIMNSIRDEQLIPLLRAVYKLEIPHAKAVKLEVFDQDIRELFVGSYPQPTRESCLASIRSVAELVRRLALKASLTMALGELPAEIDRVSQAILKVT